MKRRALLVLAALALAVVPASALGAPKATHEHIHDVGTDVDPDFCGTGEIVDIAFDVRNMLTFGPGETFKSTGHGVVVFTSRTTGLSVNLSFAGQNLDETISGDPAGLHTHRFTVKGLPEKIQTPHGPVLVRDAGLAVFEDVFNGDEFISETVTVLKGPHPDLDSDFELFCEVMTDALGIA
jgi:hypothetical protein